MTRHLWRLWLLLIVVVGSTAAMADESVVVIDPWDYNYCGGKPVYPEVGYTFATLCGPRNQIALGRRGRLMWSFPSVTDPGAGQRGSRQLTPEELNRLSLLAEVAQLADPAPPQPGKVNYQLGINFPGRPSKRVHSVKDEQYTPANKLFDAMLELIPVKPDLPNCDGPVVFFDPVQLPGSRAPLSLNDVYPQQEKSHALD